MVRLAKSRFVINQFGAEDGAIATPAADRGKSKNLGDFGEFLLPEKLPNSREYLYPSVARSVNHVFECSFAVSL